LPEIGDAIEAEMGDGEIGETEWMRGHVTKVNAKKATFVVNFKVENDLEKGDVSLVSLCCMLSALVESMYASCLIIHVL
jgi:hypothetical protein